MEYIQGETPFSRELNKLEEEELMSTLRNAGIISILFSFSCCKNLFTVITMIICFSTSVTQLHVTMALTDRNGHYQTNNSCLSNVV